MDAIDSAVNKAPMSSAQVPIDDGNDFAFDASDDKDKMNYETEQVDLAMNQPEPAKVTSSMDDEDFGDFGDFEETPSTARNEHHVQQMVQCENHPESASEFSSIEGDDFGGFGNFEEMPSEPINQNDTKNHSTAAVSKQLHEGPVTQPDMATKQSSSYDDDFGDFEEVSSAISNQRHDGKTSESLSIDVSIPPVTLLDDSVRVMFQTVFAVEGQVQFDLNREESSILPFDVMLRSVLPNESSVEETTEESCAHSEEGLANIKSFVMNLSMSHPITILSHDKWHPYSHYIFNRDGTPMVDSCETVSPNPSVPDVLCIDLPTGFDASEFSKSSKRESPCPISTAADFPIKNDPEDKSAERCVLAVYSKSKLKSKYISLLPKFFIQAF
eukprot:CCRYP_016455-RB/>CCRYP_016455-RB protein AED:0.00 eAED:0.00 QI:135/1/1/1/1/1/2/500/384